MRTLIHFILNKQAPKKKNDAWSDKEKRYTDKGDPTYRTQIRYICRFSNNRYFAWNVREDLDFYLCALGFIDKFVHE